APMLLPNRLPCPGTPRLNEPTSRRKRFKYWAATGLPTKFVGLRSVKSSAPAGGEVKSFRLTVQSRPPWQLAHPAFRKRVRPCATVEGTGALGRPAFVNGALGVRTALRTHSRR